MQSTQRVKYDAEFSKMGDMVYISHLDLMTLFRRSIRRAELPFVLTEGFTPRVKISIPRALKLGRASEEESMSFWLTEKLSEGKAADVINAELPEGVRVMGCKMVNNA